VITSRLGIRTQAWVIPCEIYTAEDAEDRLTRAKMVLDWAKRQWEQTDENN